MTAYLQSVLPTLKPLVARLTTAGSAKEGTAFLIDTNTALTCEHCLSESTAVAPTLTFEHWPGGETLRETTVVRDKQRDVAVLRLTIPAPEGLYYFPLATNALRGDEWASFGYPELLKPDPLPMGGIIPDEASSHFDHPRVQLRTDLADDRVNGMSGSPVVSEGRIVGMVANQPGRVDLIGEKHGTFRIVYAIPAPDVRTSAGDGLFLVDTSPFGALTLGQDRIAAGQRVGQLLEKYLGTVEKPVAFGGREEPLAALNSWLNDTTAPFGLLAAPSGRGKTALLVRWAEQLRRTGRARVAFVPISLRVDTARLGDISRLLYLRLRHLVGQGGPYQGAAEGAADDVARLCAMPPRPGEPPLVIILDGLDEALEWNGSPGELGIPPGPQPHIRVLMATRGDADSADRLIAERFQTWSNAQFHRFEELEYLTKDGIAAVVATLGIEPGDNNRLSERLHVLTDLGDPLLLGLYIEKIRDEQRTKSFAGIIGDLENVDSGWIGYLKAWWADQQKLWGNRPLDRRVATLLGLLASAVEPLTRNDLEGASATLEERDRLDPYDFPAIKAAAQRFTLVVPGQETTTGPTPEGYTLSHPAARAIPPRVFQERVRARSTALRSRPREYSWSTVFDEPWARTDLVRSMPCIRCQLISKRLASLSISGWRFSVLPGVPPSGGLRDPMTRSFQTSPRHGPWQIRLLRHSETMIVRFRSPSRCVRYCWSHHSGLSVACLRTSLSKCSASGVGRRVRRSEHSLQLRAHSNAIANAFVVIRDRLSDDDLTNVVRPCEPGICRSALGGQTDRPTHLYPGRAGPSRAGSSRSGGYFATVVGGWRNDRHDRLPAQRSRPCQCICGAWSRQRTSHQAAAHACGGRAHAGCSSGGYSCTGAP